MRVNMYMGVGLCIYIHINQSRYSPRVLIGYNTGRFNLIHGFTVHQGESFARLTALQPYRCPLGLGGLNLWTTRFIDKIYGVGSRLETGTPSKQSVLIYLAKTVVYTPTIW